MRRLVVAAIVGVLALSLSGCGGGGEEQAESPEAAPVATATAAVPDADVTNPIADRSAETTESFIPMSSLTTMPAEVSSNLADRKAMLLFFYNSDQKVTDDTRKQVEKVAEDNTGLVDLLTYNLGKATSIDEDGIVQVDPVMMEEDPAVAEAITFARELKVRGTPYVIVVDDQGYQIFSSKGYIDAELLGRQVERAAR